MTDVDTLLPHATTDSERGYLRAVADHGGTTAAAEALGVARGTITKAISRIKRRAGLVGHAAHTSHVPDGFEVSGVSRLLGADGDVKAEWVKTRRTREDVDVLERFMAALSEYDSDHTPVTPPEVNHDHLLAVYPYGDPHIGMLAHEPETGANFDLKIAEHNLTRAMESLVTTAPAAKRAVILQLGDFFHADNQSNTTPQSGNQLDVDGRHHRVIEVGIRIMVRCIELALAKHEHVTVINNRGNHDPTSSVMLSHVLDAHFRTDPRVEVSTNPEPYQHIEFGQCLIVTNHGDQAKHKEIPGLIAATKAAAWGRTTYRHCYLGHIHHEHRIEHPGMIVEYMRTLAARDAWHAGKYSSGRSMCVDVWDERFGFQHRNQVGVQQVEAAG